MRGKPQVLVAAGVVAVLALVVVLLGFGEHSETSSAEPVVICIDSTVSTNGVRASYLPDLAAVARRAAVHQARFYAAACGANATGTVDWPVRKKFSGSYTGDLAREQADHQAEEVIKGDEKHEGLEDLTRTSSKMKGTPLGEMLAVLARQCGQAGGECTIYLFTDGEWADKLVKVSDGVTEVEKGRYIETYARRLGTLAGSQVNFIGVGHGTKMGEVHLAEAKALAAALIQAAGGEMGSWSTRL